MTSSEVAAPADAYARNAHYRRPWYWYDWANSAFVTTTGTVLFGPYITAVAKEAACPGGGDAPCTTTLSLFGVPISPGSVAPYTVTVATILAAIVLMFVGAVADRSPRPARLLGVFAWAGAAAASAMFFVAGDNWQLGVVLMVLATVAFASSQAVYDSLLCRIAAPDERDEVSSRGWGLGYLGGGLLLAINLAFITMGDSLGVDQAMAARISMLSAGLWWAVFTIIPVVGMWRLRGVERPEVAREAGAVGGSLRQLRDTFGELRQFPQTMLFLLAYLFFNDGIQTVIGSASLYGSEELGFKTEQLMTLILMVQFVAFAGALLFGRVASRYGAWRTILASLVLWSLAVAIAFFVPHGAFTTFMVLGVLIGLVLGGSQALSRSLYSQLIPKDREAEFFSFYQAMERGTSWFGTLTFGLVHQFTGSYRWAIIALLAFFVVGGWLLSKVDVRQGITDAGNEVPHLV